MKKKIGCFLTILCCCSLCLAQQVVSSGGSTVKSDISVNWILGGNVSDILTYDQSTLDSLLTKQLTESEISFKLYPNPTTDFINIEITPVDTGRLIVELYNNIGAKVLNTVTVYQPILHINVSNIPYGIYYLKVFRPFKAQLFNVAKIIKN